MADKIQYYDVTLSAAGTTTPTVYVDKYDQLMVRVPAVASVFSSSPVKISLLAAPTVNHSTLQAHYYDYVNQTPASSIITVSTAGIYEMPYPGANQYLSLSFDVAASQTVSISLICPKTTY